MTYTLDYLDKKFQALLTKRAEEAEHELQHYMSRCTTCRMMNDYLIRQTIGQFSPYDCGMRREGDAVFCPKCNRCIYSGES